MCTIFHLYFLKILEKSHGEMERMMSILDLIASETYGSSFKTYKYSLDGIEVPRFDYDDHQYRFTWKRYGETEWYPKTVSLKKVADQIKGDEPLFRYFLDGSRKTYKVDDMSYKNQVYPVIAGQVGVGCCIRENGKMLPLCDPSYERHLVISLPKIAKSDDWDDNELSFEHLRKMINSRSELKQKGVEFAKILAYATHVEQGDKIENKGIATIQNYMIQREIFMVAELVRRGYLLPNRYLLKDGSLEYQVHGISSKAELARFKNNYRFVVGVSKSFNPAYCIDKNGRSNSTLIAKLPLYSRTPVQMYDSPIIGNVTFAVWFVRIRESRFTNNTFDGVLKLEKILVTEEQVEKGLDSEEVDMITANVIQERNPVCYGADRRWANHLYPVYVTENYVKSKYIGESMFLNLF